ncbi:hypothetical protein UFOVP376_6 [uncultured Caudovirales phage]|uniref:Uncharacterized protein n=1 Tax=uncultured Caudovirales phage TaxID=2100421 RepID=A0A6J7X5E7_9CAUD|nr:hypothetical protein UFOVP376_6 [uncultured Caudovirales phage]
MRQYTFQVVNKKTGQVDHVRATAKNPEIARNQIVLSYGLHHGVMGLHCNVNPAHHTLGEIDCSGFPMADIAWLEREAAAIEGVTAC